MPFNQLILPLLGGYLLVTYANCFVYWSSRQSKEHLLFASAFAGATLLIVARCIALFAENYKFGMWLYESIHGFVDYEGIGTASLALVLSLLLVIWINRAWSMPEAGFWLYGRNSLTQFESLMYMSFSGAVPSDGAVFRSLPVELSRRLGASLLHWIPRHQRPQEKIWNVISRYDEQTGKASPIPLLLSMKDRKVYVGILEKAPPLSASGMAYINILVMLSGYRDEKDLHVEFTDDYTSIFEGDNKLSIDIPSYKVLPVCDIASASLFDMDIFNRFKEQHNQVDGGTID